MFPGLEERCPRGVSLARLPAQAELPAELSDTPSEALAEESWVETDGHPGLQGTAHGLSGTGPLKEQVCLPCEEVPGSRQGWETAGWTEGSWSENESVPKGTCWVLRRAVWPEGTEPDQGPSLERLHMYRWFSTFGLWIPGLELTGVFMKKGSLEHPNMQNQNWGA